MNTPSARELIAQIAELVEQRSSLDDFYRWFTPYALALPRDDRSPVAEAIRDVELWFPEYTSGYRAENGLRSALVDAARKLRAHAA